LEPPLGKHLPELFEGLNDLKRDVYDEGMRALYAKQQHPDIEEQGVYSSYEYFVNALCEFRRSLVQDVCWPLEDQQIQSYNGKTIFEIFPSHPIFGHPYFTTDEFLQFHVKMKKLYQDSQLREDQIFEEETFPDEVVLKRDVRNLDATMKKLITGDSLSILCTYTYCTLTAVSP